MYIQIEQTIAITTFETEISNFFKIDFSHTSLLKEPFIKRKIVVVFENKRI